MRRFQAPVAAKSQGDVDDPRTNVSLRFGSSIGQVGNSSDSQYRMRYFMIGISVLCLSTFLVIHLLVSTRIRNISSFLLYGDHGERINGRGDGDTLPMCWDGTRNASSSEWKATLVGRFRTVKSHDYDGIHIADLMQRGRSHIDSIRRDPRYFYDVSHLYDAAHGSATSQEMRKVPQRDILDMQMNSTSSSPRLEEVTFLPSAITVRNHSGSGSGGAELHVELLNYRDSVTPDAGVCVRESETLGFRCLPSFLIIGAMKSGTGQLLDWLNLHPNLQSGVKYRIGYYHSGIK